jgi:hypothetical protein
LLKKKVPFREGYHRHLEITVLLNVSAVVKQIKPVMHQCHPLPHLGLGRPGIFSRRQSL